jgi:RNA polymerase sigma factor (sigma-70 family)
MKALGLSMCLLQSQPDGRLVELARGGHERAFEALVQRHRRALMSYARRISSSDAGAEDAVQQALLHAWLALGKPGTEVRDVRAWLHRIVHNVAISNVRRPTAVLREVESADGATGADSEFERRLAANEALAGLAALPDLQRQVMLCTALEGRSHEEIATTFGLSQGAVRGLIYRARATLRAAAAAWVPAPLVNWVARQPPASGGTSTGIYEALASGGSVGLAGVLVKSGAVVLSIGAIAAATGLPAVDPGGGSAHAVRAPRSANASARPAAPPAVPTAHAVVATHGIAAGPPLRISVPRGASESGRRGGHRSGRSGGSGRGGSSSRGSGSSGRDSGSGSGSSGRGSGGSSDGSGGLSGGSGGSSDGSISTGGSGSDGGTGSSGKSVPSAGSGSGSGRGSSDVQASSGSSDGGGSSSGSGSSDGGSSGNGSSGSGSAAPASTSGSNG